MEALAWSIIGLLIAVLLTIVLLFCIVAGAILATRYLIALYKGKVEFY